ncbi:hypothetical protein T484DRAFT_1955322 [Baffinella frigidus]|nr:hypothetical protein T484DRAFT_1955322 [Cryptophyta sp. CCMP2293]
MTVTFGHPTGISGPEAEFRNKEHEANWALSRKTEEQGWTDSKHLYKVPPFNNEPYREDLGYWSKTKQPTPLWVDLPGPLAQPAPGQPGPEGVPETGSSEVRWGAPVARKMPEALLEQLKRMERLREQVSAANQQSQQLLESELEEINRIKRQEQGHEDDTVQKLRQDVLTLSPDIEEISPKRGRAGEQGQRGVRGIDGEPGRSGQQGRVGPKGYRGPQGFPGDAGLPGQAWWGSAPEQE